MKTICQQCAKEFSIQPKEFRKSAHHFCSRSCAAKFNNHVYPKRISVASLTCRCGTRKDRRAKQCHHCKIKQTLDIQLKRTLQDAALLGNARIKWAHVRKVARKVLVLSNRPAVCHMCSFSLALEVCHIRPISSFPVTATLGEVNSEDNLVYLCPNHHALLDRGLLSL